MRRFLEKWPWTQTTKAVFLVLAVLTWIASIVLSCFGKTLDGNLYTYVLAGLGVGMAAMVGKRATHRVEVETRTKRIEAEHADVEFTP